MAEPIKTKIIQPKSTELTEYLRKVSQSIYNLRKIIDAHLVEPIGDDKDLNSFYLDEIDILYTLLRNPVGQSIISSEYIRSNLSSNLMFNRGKTESAQKELNLADDCIRRVLGKVQNMRRKHYGSSIPAQGLEEGHLKTFLVDFVSQKLKINDEPKKVRIEFANSDRTQSIANKLTKSIHDDLIIGSLVYKIDEGIYFKNRPIKMRPQIKILCFLFMKHHKRFIEYATIKDELTDPRKNRVAGFKNIEKYVSELHKILCDLFRKKVIFNDELEGYIFDTERDS